MTVDWFRSFYWRIGASFAILVVLVVIGQGIMVTALLESDSGPFGPGNATAAATTIAAALGQAPLPGDAAGLTARLHDVAPRSGPPAFVVMSDGLTAVSTTGVLRPAVRRHVEAALAGRAPDDVPGEEPVGPVVMAPIHQAGILRGLVVLPPPPRRGWFASVAELLSLPGTLLLTAGAALAALIIFGTARRRLRGLEEAAVRFGRGDTGVRAPEHGRDEIASVARAFNSMATDLAGRDEALRRSARARQQMLADVSHELRTPLTAMRGFLDTLTMPELALDAATRESYLHTVRDETTRLSRLVEDLLDLARMENDAGALAPRVFAIERAFDHVMRRHARDAAAAGVQLTKHISQDADQLCADADRIEQVVGNLVANALKHTPSGGTIDLRATALGSACELSVVDSGAGIPQEHQTQIFERFYRTDAARARRDGGTGLGLSIVKAIVERHGGTIRLESRPGRTAFIINLPAAIP